MGGFKVKKEIITKTIKGYKRAGEFIKSEKKTTLRSLTPESSLAIFCELWSIWEKSQKSGNIHLLDRIKIEYLIKRRRALDRLAGRRASG